MSEIKIQCPECGAMIKHLQHTKLSNNGIYSYQNDLWVCNECPALFNEDDIRKRCGL